MSVEALRVYVEELLAQQGFPGFSVAVTDREHIVASETFGLANLDAGTPVTRETYFELGSIGKTFTAVVALQLHEQGELDLEAPLTRYLPWFEVRSEYAPIAIRHLLTHSSGLMTGAELSASSRFDVWALRETEAGFAPGTNYLYSNVGYRALGLVIEDVTGMRYPDVLRGRILEPLGLEATDPEVTSEGRHRLAVGYERRYDDRPALRADPWVPAPWLETATGDGSPAATMQDLAVFLRALLNGGQGVLSRDSFELMTTPAVEANDGWWYGCGLELHEREGRQEIRHGGSMPGFGATMLGDLDSGLGVAVAVNSVDERDLTEVIAEAILDLYRADVPPPVPNPLAVENRPDYVGLYEGEAGRLVVSAKDDHLLVNGVSLEAQRNDRFFTDHPDLALFPIRFLREDGHVVAAAHGGNVYRRDGVAAASAPAPPEEWKAYQGHYRAYNPWYSNFRVVLREAGLVMIWAWGFEQPLEPLGEGLFRVDDEWSPERLHFDAIVDGQALRATLSGEAYYRIA